MEFPDTYIDAVNRNLQEFLDGVNNNADSFAQALRGEKSVKTGTTILAFLSRNKKIGVLVSDGRVSMGTYTAQEDFRKIFRCRVGFVGIAGTLFLAQLIAPAFRKDVDMICSGRDGRLITASGALRRLFAYYSGVAGKFGSDTVLDMIPLFWDEKNSRCRLYALRGMCHLDDLPYAFSGSGSGPIMSSIMKCQQTDSKDEMLQNARNLLRDAAGVDMATNTKMSYAIIDNGEFFEGEEAL